MARKIYASVAGKSKNISPWYASVDEKSKEIVKAYCSVDGKAKLFYEKGVSPWTTIYNNGQFFDVPSGVSLLNDKYVISQRTWNPNGDNCTDVASYFGTDYSIFLPRGTATNEMWRNSVQNGYIVQGETHGTATQFFFPINRRLDITGWRVTSRDRSEGASQNNLYMILMRIVWTMFGSSLVVSSMEQIRNRADFQTYTNYNAMISSQVDYIGFAYEQPSDSQILLAGCQAEISKIELLSN